MKNTWITPELTKFGAVEELTEQVTTKKKFGGSDGFVLVITSDVSVPISDFS